MDNIDQLEQLVAEARTNANKLYNKGTKSAAPRLRKNMQSVKSLCQNIRVHSLEHLKSLPTKKRGGAADEEEDSE